MKRIALALIAAAVASPAFAQLDVKGASSSLALSGSVPQVLTITAPAGTAAVNLGSTTSQGIGAINLRSNVVNGFVASVSSVNGGQLKGATTGNPTVFAYKITSPAGSHSVTAQKTALFTVTDSATKNAAATVGGLTQAIGLAIQSIPASVFADTYTDTLTFYIDAN